MSGDGGSAMINKGLKCIKTVDVENDHLYFKHM
jgi:hypothetical protein